MIPQRGTYRSAARTLPSAHGGEWTEHEGKRLPIYGLRYTESADGLIWGSPRQLLDPDRAEGQIGFGRPYLMRVADGWRMYLSVRTVNGYTLSHGYSADGLVWHGWQHEVIPRSPEGWDSQMICYGAAALVNGLEYVFYNGNQFGRSGGVAVRTSD